ncbi:hypothetical protein JIN85_05640 [Luteolibacter pohnpeiensis]|uniref:SLA1 homology domain-containing protein n=1 Tax=Luteolibacter pohnpeiensis TaxID=454153 RepID=A0A934VQA0_9BACT|nr:hypothetical protein [Luteolibacter pohnpeiensis]MBK1881886.1 hypothetical protein [Luteolibacter pohnpeiensis]
MKITILALCGLLAGMAHGREWMSSDRKFIEAEYVKLDGDVVVLKMGKKEVRLPMERLSEVDQQWVLEQDGNQNAKPKIKKQVQASLPTTADFDAPVPRQVGPPADVTIETVKEDADANEYVYESNRFEFHCNRRLTSRLIEGFAKLYEATYDAVQAMPWGATLDPRNPSGKFVVKLFTEEADFLAAGGIKGSAGTATGAVSLAQLRFLGVKDTGSRLILEDISDNATVVHELTHSLRNEADHGLPTWAVEGFAEYIASAPYQRSGRFDFDHRLKVAAQYSNGKNGASGGVFKLPMRLEKFLGASRSEFYKDENGGLGKGAGINYAMSVLLMTYFWHADKGKDQFPSVGGPVRAWLQAIKNGKSEREARPLLLDGRTYEEVEKSFVEAYRGDIKLEF